MVLLWKLHSQTGGCIRLNIQNTCLKSCELSAGLLLVAQAAHACGLSWVLSGRVVVIGQAANITDQDIDAIIQKGQRATEELNNKMKQFTENAMAFTLDGGINAYEFKDEDDVPDEVPDLKQLMGALPLGFLTWSGFELTRVVRTRTACPARSPTSRSSWVRINTLSSEGCTRFDSVRWALVAPVARARAGGGAGPQQCCAWQRAGAADRWRC